MGVQSKHRRGAWCGRAVHPGAARGRKRAVLRGAGGPEACRVTSSSLTELEKGK